MEVRGHSEDSGLSFRAMAATSISEFNEAFVRELHVLQAEFGPVSSYDILFLSFLNAASEFGFVRIGPVVIDVSQVEAVVRASGNTTGSDYNEFSRLLMREWKKSGRARIDTLHFLYAFMRCGQGVAARVFGELGTSPDDVDAWLRRPPESAGGDELLTPEDVADYLKVHVETVRLWIRSGRLPAYRLGGLRALRIRRSDVDALLLPVESGDSTPLQQGGHEDANLSD